MAERAAAQAALPRWAADGTRALGLVLLSLPVSCLQTSDATVFRELAPPGAATVDLAERAPEQSTAPLGRLGEQLALEPVRDALCTWAVAGSGGGQPLCESAYERCQNALGMLSFAGNLLSAPLAELDPSVDLAPLLACPVSLDQVAACGADLLAWLGERYADNTGCDPAPAPLELGLRDLLVLGNCVSLARQCPNLLGAALLPGE